MESAREIVFKVIIIGNTNVGKTSLIIQYCEHRFSDNYIATIGSNFAIKIISIPDQNINVRLQIWDLAGQIAFNLIRPDFYRGSSGGVFVFDITDRESFEKIPKWIEESRKELHDLPYILVGNKLDLEDDRLVSHKEGVKLAKKIGACAYIETSAKMDQNIEQLFQTLANEMLNRFNNN